MVLEEVREQHQLHDRVHLLGSLKHEHVRDVSIYSDIQQIYFIVQPL